MGSVEINDWNGLFWSQINKPKQIRLMASVMHMVEKMHRNTKTLQAKKAPIRKLQYKNGFGIEGWATQIWKQSDVWCKKQNMEWDPDTNPKPMNASPVRAGYKLMFRC